MIHEVIGYIEVKNENRQLVFDSADKSKEVLKKYTELWDGIKNEIETINGGETGKYGKDLKFPAMAIVVRSVFEEDGKYYPGVYLNECLYEL